jgi:hypothetical protein
VLARSTHEISSGFSLVEQLQQRLPLRSVFMLAKLVKKIFGSSNDRSIKRLQKDVDAINVLEAGLQSLSASVWIKAQRLIHFCRRLSL